MTEQPSHAPNAVGAAKSVVEDVKDLAQKHALLARAEIKETAAGSVVTVGLALLGGWLVATGATMLVVTPATAGKTRWRMAALAAAYLVGGATVAGLGGRRLYRILTRALHRSREELEKTTEMVKEQV